MNLKRQGTCRMKHVTCWRGVEGESPPGFEAVWERSRRRRNRLVMKVAVAAPSVSA